ncbi:MAG: hypothetical protein DRJ43_01680 [Thermoprotei archaeon]|nr:MAG: hypothetical protein DRJ43_01680 [Thermoprotei archaeon]
MAVKLGLEGRWRRLRAGVYAQSTRRVARLCEMEGEHVEEVVLEALKGILESHRGSLAVVKSKSVARRIGIKPTSSDLSIICSILRKTGSVGDWVLREEDRRRRAARFIYVRRACGTRYLRSNPSAATTQ